jgi:hypothetical protein
VFKCDSHKEIHEAISCKSMQDRARGGKDTGAALTAFQKNPESENKINAIECDYRYPECIEEWWCMVWYAKKKSRFRRIKSC